MNLTIVNAGDPVLRQAARPLGAEEVGGDYVRSLVSDMKELMRSVEAVGLAAPQVGESVQLAVIEDRLEDMASLSDERRNDLEVEPVPFQVIINPKLVRSGEEERLFFEGCLSVPGYMGLVARAREVQVEALNEKGEHIRIAAVGWHARILQHEIDHLRGILYIDHMEKESFTTDANHAKFWNSRSVELKRLLERKAGRFSGSVITDVPQTK
jgi:peptide deformylase